MSASSTLAKIDRQIDAGNLAYAETLAHTALEKLSDTASLNSRLAKIASILKQSDTANRFAKGQIYAKPIDPNARRSPSDPVNPLPKPDQFLLIKAWGYGFWAEITYVIAQLCLAEMTGRAPVVHWGGNSLYSDDPDADAFQAFFAPVSSYRLEDLISNEYAYHPAKWNADNLGMNDINKTQGENSKMPGIYFLNRDEQVCIADYYSGLVNLMPWIHGDSHLAGLSQNQLSYYLYEKYLKPVASVTLAVNLFCEQHFQEQPFVAVHVRGSDKVLEEDDNRYTRDVTVHRLEQWLQKNGSDTRIFLMTDEIQILELFLRKYGEQICYTECIRTDSLRGVHYMRTEETRNRTALGHEVMVDAYIAARASYFIGNGFSNASCAVRFLKRWEPFTCKLLGGNALNRRIPKLYKPDA